MPPLSNAELVAGQNEIWNYELGVPVTDARDFGAWMDLVEMVPIGATPALFGDVMITSVTMEPTRDGTLVNIMYVEVDPRMNRDDGSEVVFETQESRKVSFLLERWYKATEIDLDKLQDNPAQRLAFSTWLREMGRSAANEKNYDFWEVALTADTSAPGVGFDQQPLFDVSHPALGIDRTPTTFRNLFLATPLSKDNLKLVLNEMNDWRTRDGHPAGIVWTPRGLNPATGPSFRLFYGPSLSDTVAEILSPDPNAQNVLAGQFEARPVHSLTGANEDTWFVQPIRNRTERTAAFYMVDAGRIWSPPTATDESVKLRRKGEGVCWARWKIHPGHWHEIAKCTA